MQLNESLISDAAKKISLKAKDDLLQFYNKSIQNSKSKVSHSATKIKTIVSKVEDFNKLKQETKNLKILSKAGLKWAINGFPQDMYNKMNMLEDGDIINNNNLTESIESILFEARFSLPYVFNELIEKLKHTFPFNLFEAFSLKVEGFTKKSLETISIFLAKVHAIDQPFYFDILPAIIGSIAELVSEDFGEDTLLDFIPGIGFLLKTISLLSYGLTITSVINSISKDFQNG